MQQPILDFLPDRRVVPDAARLPEPANSDPGRPDPPAQDGPAPVVRQIRALQADLSHRRRRAAVGLWLRLLIFVLLPTCAAAYFFVAHATPLYEAEAEIVVITQTPALAQPLPEVAQSAEAGRDAIALQGYLTSLEALGSLRAANAPGTDFGRLTLRPFAGLVTRSEQARDYALFQRLVRIAFDPTEGVLRARIRAESPAAAIALSEALIGLGEARLEGMGARVREGRLARARSQVAEAEAARNAATEHLIALQVASGLVNPDEEERQFLDLLGGLEETRLAKLQLLSDLSADPGIAASRLASVREEIDRLDGLIRDARARATPVAGPAGEGSGTVAIRVAQAELRTREAMLEGALAALEAARADAESQRKYLVTSVQPRALDVPVYPSWVREPLIAFAVFAGLYLFGSLSWSVLREQL